jgi:hypothetical protein
VRTIKQFASLTGVGLLLLAKPALGQVQVGDASMNMNGTVSAGYSAVYGDQIGSSHNLGFGGTGTLSGSYYSPSFLNFNFSPYYNQSRANSNFQSITESSGFNFNSGIFSGSHFPGSISYAKAYNSEGNFALPGLPNYTTHGNSDVFGITWSEVVPGLPSLSVGYQQGGNQYSVYGTNDNGNTGLSDRRFFLERLLPKRRVPLADSTGIFESAAAVDHKIKFRRIWFQCFPPASIARWNLSDL